MESETLKSAVRGQSIGFVGLSSFVQEQSSFVQEQLIEFVGLTQRGLDLIIIYIRESTQILGLTRRRRRHCSQGHTFSK